MMIIIGIDILFFSIVGICLICGKGSWMISGYNTMSKEEKENCNIKKISRTVGTFLLMIAVVMVVMSFVAFVIQYATKNDIENIIGYIVGSFTFVIIIGIIILVVILQKHNNNKK